MGEAVGIKVLSATIRGGRLELVLSLAGPLPGGLSASDPILEVRFTTGANTRALLPDAVQTLSVVRLGDCLEQDDARVVVLALPPGPGPLVSVAVGGLPAHSVVTFDEEVEAQLMEVFPLDDETFERRFIHKVKRWGGIDTEYFIARQIAHHFVGAAAYRCSAATVMGYKATESGDPTMLDEAAEALTSAQSWLADCKVDWHPRRNREHLRASTLTALWHVALAQGDRDGFLRALEAVRDSGVGLKNYFTPAYPLTKGLLMLGYVYWRFGNTPAATKTWRRCVEVFRFAVRDANPNKETLFGELAESHRAAHCATKCLRAALHPKHAPPVNSAMVLAASARVRGDPAKRLEQALDAMLARPPS